MTFFATITKQRQLNIPAKAMRYMPEFKNPGRVRMDVENGSLIVKPIKDFLELGGSLEKYGKRNKGKSLQQIIKGEEEAVADAAVERYLRTLKKHD